VTYLNKMLTDFQNSFTLGLVGNFFNELISYRSHHNLGVLILYLVKYLGHLDSLSSVFLQHSVCSLCGIDFNG